MIESFKRPYITHSLTHSSLDLRRRGELRAEEADNLRHVDLSWAVVTSSSVDIKVHSLMLSDQLFLWRPFFLLPSTVPCMQVLARLLFCRVM